MKIVFRTSGGRIPKRELGLGHIYRCINLSKELTSHKITFLIEDYGSVSSVLKQNNLKTIKLKPGLTENLDIKKTVEFVNKNKVDIVIIDKYGLTNRYVQTIKKITKVVVISDLRNIQYDADLVINGFIGYKNKILRNKYGTKCLLGPAYQIINSKHTNTQDLDKNKIDILVTFGGFDSANIIPVLIKSLKNCIGKNKIKIILGPSTKKTKELTKMIQKYKKQIAVIQETSNMHKEISHAKFGFCGGGITAYEFAHMKTPFAMICQYKHQLIAAREWKKLGLALNLGLLSKSTPLKIQNIINDLEKTRVALKPKRIIVDGLGSSRIRKEILDINYKL